MPYCTASLYTQSVLTDDIWKISASQKSCLNLETGCLVDPSFTPIFLERTVLTPGLHIVRMPFVNGTWDGPEKIILAIDIGTTYSAVSYSHLYKGCSRSITSVSNWPNQRKQVGDSKIPTLIWYDKRKKPVRYGASALVANAMEAKENGWQLAKLFKLNLHPDTMRSEHRLKTSDLPDGIPLTQIYSDFIQYLLKHTRHFFETRVVEGESVWNNHINSADIVITYPNGWGIHEQDVLRKAAISAGCPDPTKTTAHIHFLTEAEASVHFCMLQADIGSDWLKPGVQFAVCDAGGSTIDITTYEVTRTNPSLLLEEKRASACIQAGAIFS
ncbi:hypothetical protein BS47DRAFT_64108 [Hydnum rufescens UP504]|uniref:Uncharacterized protein n=1 Tax=Hydnum rufescens UP504 TaxID=1448309 RepID=A0A9P6AS89_9AGAM|nr:hypothetical protein BS47DRAFT_64108 [Hydnum rufescens UP504]